MSDALSLLAAPLIEEAARASARPTLDAVLERPADPEHGDYATTLALRLAKPLRRAPREIAEELAAAARASEWVASADVAGPGFVNVRVSPAWYAEAVRAAREPGLRRRHRGDAAAGQRRVRLGQPDRARCRCSAGRNAAYGDSLARAVRVRRARRRRASTTSTTPASQIERFGLSLRARARGEPVPEDGYHGRVPDRRWPSRPGCRPTRPPRSSGAPA